MAAPTRGDVIRQLDILRGGLRIAMTTIQKMKKGLPVDAEAVLNRLALIRAEAKEVRDAVKPANATSTSARASKRA